jgi:hypothetical protein
MKGRVCVWDLLSEIVCVLEAAAVSLARCLGIKMEIGQSPPRPLT